MKDNRYIDATVAVRLGMPIWPGHPPLELERVRSIALGASSNVTRLALSVHTGTHVDAPVHFFDDRGGVEDLPLDRMIGRAYLINLGKVARVTAKDLEHARIPPRTRRLLIRTRNSELWARGEEAFREDFVALDPTAAEWVVRQHIRLVGVDYLSVAPWKEGRPTHEILLSAGVLILEGLDLHLASAGRYRLFCLPLRIVGSDGAPARVVLERLGGNR